MDGHDELDHSVVAKTPVQTLDPLALRGELLRLVAIARSSLRCLEAGRGAHGGNFRFDSGSRINGRLLDGSSLGVDGCVLSLNLNNGLSRLLRTRSRRGFCGR